MAVNRAVFMRKARRFVSSFLPLVLAVSTLSAISVITAPNANASANAEFAFDFNKGVSNTVVKTANNSGPIPATTDFTVETWVNVDSYTNNWQTLIVQDQGETDGQGVARFYLGFPTTTNKLHLGFAGEYQDLDYAIPLNTWTHVALTVQRIGGNLTTRPYINGSLLTNATKTNWTNVSLTSAKGFAVGTATDGGFELDGKLDQVKVWNGVLSAADIQKSMYAYSSEGITGNTLRAHYDFNEGTGTTITDRSGNSLNMTATLGSSSFFGYTRPPFAPTIGTAVAGNASASIPFTAPSSNRGAVITSYTATSNPGNITGTLSQAGSGTITVNGLTNGTAYTFTVTATNSAGTSVASVASNSVTPTFPACAPTTNPSPPSGFTVLTFTNTTTCNWSVPEGVTQIQYLVVAGGGGGAGGQASEHGGGGGGAGGLLSGTLNVTTSTISVLVGAGGTGGVSGARGTSGSNSSLGTGITAVGGGAGGTYFTNGALAGGSGGGAGAGNFTSGANGEAGQGNNGGSVSRTGTNGRHGAGGGGAGGAGGSTTDNGTITTSAGAGGIGIQSSITGTSVTYAGGGGGGGSTKDAGSTGGGAGGSSIGGAGATWTGSVTTEATAGTAGTGSGGGGGIGTGGGSASGGGNGGSGVVIVRYVNAPSISLSSNSVTGAISSAITSYSISNSGGSVDSYSIPSADSTAITAVGLSFSTSTGLISGTPTGTLASRSITITATNTSGTSAATFSLVVENQACSPSSTSSGGFTTVTFTNSTTCNWAVPSGVNTAQVLVVGGGGGGGDSLGGQIGGTGGAGGFFSSNTVAISGTISVRAGAGGSAGQSGNNLSLIHI